MLPRRTSSLVILGCSVWTAAAGPAFSQTSGKDTIVATRLMDRAPLCFVGKVGGPCQDWQPDHAYHIGDQILPKNGNAAGLTLRATTTGKSNTTPPVWPQSTNTEVQDGPTSSGVHWIAQDTITRHFIRVDFSDPHDEASAKQSDVGFVNTTVLTTPSNKSLKLTKDGTFNSGFSNLVVTFELSSDAITPPGDTGVKVCFATYTFKGKKEPVTDLCGDGKIYNDANVADLVHDSQQALSNAVSTAKTSAEKNIFGGLSISVPSGGGDTQGSGDLNLNHYFAFPLVGQGVFGLEIKKGSSVNADPRHFTGGIKARKVWLLGVSKADLNALISAIESSSGELNADAVSKIGGIQAKYFRSIYFDNGLSYEGDISNGNLGNISNVLYNGETWVNTAVRSLTKQTGFYNFRILPVGIEAGYNVSANSSASLSGAPSTITTSSSAPSPSYSIARLKSGATFTLSSESPFATTPSPRLDLEVSAVNRYLFEKELIYDGKAKSYSSTGVGNKYWVQLALKFLGGSIGSGSFSGRPGLRLAFERGSLPPVYSFTKVFTVSLIYETNDNSSQEIALVNQK